MQPTKERIALSPETNEALKKLGWGGWEPKVGDFYLLQGKVGLVSDPLITLERTRKSWAKYNVHPIPLLHWEQIESILEELGHRMDVWPDDGSTDSFILCGIRPKGQYYSIIEEDRTRQLAVMKTVIALAKEVKK